MCVSALKSEGWNLLKFGKVQRIPQMPCSVLKTVVHRMTATVNHLPNGVGKGMGIIIKAVLPTEHEELHSARR